MALRAGLQSLHCACHGQVQRRKVTTLRQPFRDPSNEKLRWPRHHGASHQPSTNCPNSVHAAFRPSTCASALASPDYFPSEQQDKPRLASDSRLDEELGKQCASLLRKWLNADEVEFLLEHQDVQGPDMQGRLAAATSVFRSPEDDSLHVAFAVGVALDAPMIPPGDHVGSDPLSWLSMHWGVVEGGSDRWQPPRPGWHTYPEVSYDAGGGAWQTPFTLVEKTQGSLSSWGASGTSLHMVLVQLPLRGAIKRGGLSFVLKTHDERWLSSATGSNFHLHTARAAGLNSGRMFVPSQARPSSGDGTLSTTNGKGRSSAGRNGSSNSSHSQQGSAAVADGPHAVARARSSVTHSGSSSGSGSDGERSADEEDFNRRAARAAWSDQGGLDDEGLILEFLRTFSSSQRPHDAAVVGYLGRSAGSSSSSSTPDGSVESWMVNAVVDREQGAARSLMHRYNAAYELVELAMKADRPEKALVPVLVWLRFSAARHLVWNRNYNVKPREISAAQDRLNTLLAHLHTLRPDMRGLLSAAMAAVGRGGKGEVGQRIRDEILIVQQRNNCKGGMMEEWHQKLHNNTSPDDVVICQALIDYIKADCDISAYWATLKASNITAERLRSFDRPITSEPHFSAMQAPGLLRDLQGYLQTLRAVHSGDDLASAAANVLGYKHRDMRGHQVDVSPVDNVANPPLRLLLASVLFQQQAAAAAASKDSGAVAAVLLLLQLVVEARHMLQPIISTGDTSCGGRLRDVIFLDMALDSTARAGLESVMGHLRAHTRALLESNPPSSGSVERLGEIIAVARWAVENAALSAAREGNQVAADELCYSLRWLEQLSSMGGDAMQKERAMQALAIVDRLKRMLGQVASDTISRLQPTAEALGGRLNVPRDAVAIYGEEAVRGAAAAPVAQVLAVLEPSLRRLAGGGDWQLVSRGNERGVTGILRVESSLATVQYERWAADTVLLIDQITGHEEVPEGAVAVIITGDCPDVLSHSAVRARNSGIIMAGCLDRNKSAALASMAGQTVSVSLTGSGLQVLPSK